MTFFCCSMLPDYFFLARQSILTFHDSQDSQIWWINKKVKAKGSAWWHMPSVNKSYKIFSEWARGWELWKQRRFHTCLKWCAMVRGDDVTIPWNLCQDRHFYFKGFVVITVLKRANFFYFIDVFTAAKLMHRFLFVFLQIDLFFQVSAAPKMCHKEPRPVAAISRMGHLHHQQWPSKSGTTPPIISWERR